MAICCESQGIHAVRGLPKCGNGSSVEIQLYIRLFFGTFKEMKLKKFLLFLPVLVLAGCTTTATFTHMTPSVQVRNANNLYPVEVAFDSAQQSLRWDTLKPYVLVDGQALPLRPVPVVNNRWEGLIPVPATKNSVTYRFKFDYLYNSFGADPQPNSAWSPSYTLKIIEQ
jgi:hypothetical protein